MHQNQLHRAEQARTHRWNTHVLALAFGTHLMFGSISLINALKPGFFYYFPRKIELVITDHVTDLVIWAVSVLCLSILSAWSLRSRSTTAIVEAAISVPTIGLAVALLSDTTNAPNEITVSLLFVAATAQMAFFVIWPDPIAGPPRRSFISAVLVYLLAYLTAIEASSGIHYVAQAFDTSTKIGVMDAGLELQLSYLSYGALPLLYAGFLFSWAWTPLLVKFLERKESIRSYFRSAAEEWRSSDAQPSVSKALAVLLDYRFFAALALGVFIGYYPYLQNPSWLVGTDAFWRYHDPLLRVGGATPQGWLAQALHERHPVPLALFYLIQMATGTTAFEVVRFAPLVLVTTLGLATFWFLAGGRMNWFGMIAIVISMLSVTTTVGMYSSILSNWMALVVWVIVFAYLARKGNNQHLGAWDALALMAMSALVLFIHPWTWGVFAASLVIVAVVTLIRDRRGGLRSGVMLISILIAEVAFALIGLTLFSGAQGWASGEEALGLYTRVISDPAKLLVFSQALVRLTQVWAQFFSPLCIAVSIIGVVYLQATTPGLWRRRLILAWICASAIGSILVAPVSFDPTQPTRTESQLWRLLFLTPFQLTMPFGLMLLTRLAKGPPIANMGVSTRDQSSGYSRVTLLLSVFVTGSLLALAPAAMRPLILIFLATVTLVIHLKSGLDEKDLLSDLIIVGVALVAFNYSTRALAQLLIDPHNYIP